MTEYIVSLYAATGLMSLDELSNCLGIEPDRDSHDKGSLHVSSTPEREVLWEQTIWKLESDLPAAAPLEEHLQFIVDQLPKLDLQSDSLPQDISLTVDVAMMTDAPICYVPIPAKWLEIFATNKLGVEISCYPNTEFEQVDD